MDSQAQAKQDAHDMAHPAPVPNSLPPRPARAPSTSPDRSPPRKRPRTQAIRRAAPAPAPPPSTIPPPLPSSTSTKDFAVTKPPSRFPIQPLNRFHGPSARIKRPQEVAHFSYDDTHIYRPDDSSLTYYHRPTLGSDLKAGFSSFNHYEDTEDPHLDSLLRAVASAERVAGEKIEAHIVTWRGMMTKLLTAPFDAFAEFEMRCTLLDGCIYLEEDFSAKQKSRENEAKRPPRGHNPNLPDHAMMSYWGYKFETLSMLPVPPGEETPQALDTRATTPVSNHAQYCSIVSTSLGPHTLLLGGEVDGLSAPRIPSSPPPWVELKTSEELPASPSHRDILRFERKLLKFWAQSFLLGVPRIVIGWRTSQPLQDFYQS
ncbi:hypothetical protein GRF29_161g1398596 [Pseudopithomyces chartarum]|uniref:Decapping nuclease n=1 Tax=Pseudopithomyces chartarum TaxID=1892770 RepID=A0AAN6REK8_9PLEO|nr:hypothetical protein GRF29_161g1398596 [Pseudopithomyces chartarum]